MPVGHAHAWPGGRNFGHGVLPRALARTTHDQEVAAAGPYYYAEEYHQQYLHKNPGGYCNHGPNGLSCPVGVARQ